MWGISTDFSDIALYMFGWLSGIETVLEMTFIGIGIAYLISERKNK